MRSVKYVGKFYIVLKQRRTIFKVVGDGKCIPYYSIDFNSYHNYMKPFNMNNGIERVYLTRAKVKKIIDYHMDKYQFDLNWVMDNIIDK